MLRVLFALLVVGLAVYALVDWARTDPARVRVLPKMLWLLVIAFVLLLGPLAWLLVGRDRGAGRSGPVQPPRPVAPDDDPDFLRDLDIDRWRRERGDEDAGGDDPQRV